MIIFYAQGTPIFNRYRSNFARRFRWSSVVHALFSMAGVRGSRLKPPCPLWETGCGERDGANCCLANMEK